MSVEGAIRQLRRHVSAFGRPFTGVASSSASSASGSSSTTRNGTSSAAGSGVASPLSAASSGGAGGGGGGGGGESGRGEEELEGAEVVPYRHHAWLSRQYLVFGEVRGGLFMVVVVAEA